MSFFKRIFVSPAPAIQPWGLISVLTDLTTPLGDRDDAAMDLCEYDEATPILAMIMSREGEDEMIVDSCANSLYEIFERTQKVDRTIVNQMPKHWQDAVSKLEGAHPA